MPSYLILFGIILVGFIVYFLLRDKLFDPTSDFPMVEPMSMPAAASVEFRHSPIYPERVVVSSGPNPPSAAASNEEVIIHQGPRPTDPYKESHESADIPENLRHPERSFRPPPVNDNQQIAVQGGIASERKQNSDDNAQQYQTEVIQGGGEFMPGIFANDTFNDASYSAF